MFELPATFLPATFWPGVTMSVIYALVAIFALTSGFKLFDLLLNKIDIQAKLNESPVAIAIVTASFILGLAYIIATVVA